MRSLTTLVTVAALVLGTAAVTVAAPRDPFKGPWVSIDSADGSSQRLTFGGNGASRNATLRDDGASVCGYPGVDASTVARGRGTVAGNTITVDYTGRCQPGGSTWSASPIEYTYDPDTNSLLESDPGGTVWTRP